MFCEDLAAENSFENPDVILPKTVTGQTFEDGKLTLEQIYEYGKKVEEPKQTSGKQEKYETIVALYSK